LYGTLREAGHEPVALLTIRDAQGRYGNFDVGSLLDEVPLDVGVLIPARRTTMAARLAERPSVAPAAPPRPRARRVGDPARRAGDRDHVPPHGGRPRYGPDLR